MEISDTPFQDYLHRHHDSGLLLAAIAESISSNGESVATKLLATDYEGLLKEVGWELLEMFIPHLTPSRTNCLALINQIVTLSSPKEMSLALMEQLQVTSSTSTLTLLLPSLQTALLNIKSQVVVDRTLSDCCSLLQQHSTVLKQQYASTQTARNSLEEKAEKEEEEEEGEEEEGEEEERIVVTNGVTRVSFASSILDFLSPFTCQIHDLFCQTGGRVDWWGWSGLQQQCVGVLLDLLEHPVSYFGKKEKEETEEDIACCVMRDIVYCHCGCLQLLEYTEEKRSAVWRRRKGKHGGDKEEEEEEEEEVRVSLSRVGLAVFAYHLLVESCESSYLPAVLSSEHLLLTGVHHTVTLLTSSDTTHCWRGLMLLDQLMMRVTPTSVPPSMLDGTSLQQTSKVLCDIMIGSSKKKVRQKAVQLFSVFIGLFSERGRYLLLQHLLKSVSHVSIQGLLIHTVKEEVSRSLKKEENSKERQETNASQESHASLSDTLQKQLLTSYFLGSNLSALSSQFLTASSSMDVMDQFDRIMAALNYLRYLLLRDHPSQDKTMVWAEVENVKQTFLCPLRAAITTTQQYCKAKLATLSCTSSQGTAVEPEVNVTIGGEELPAMSPQMEQEMFETILSRLDLLTSILVRVEELCSC